MCGIAGLVYAHGEPERARETVREMIAVQSHRGPDGRGFVDRAGASLGHARLAILDLSDAGRQPMADHEGRAWITFNGEIYNYLELAAELRGLGHTFRSTSDTEVLLAAWRQWGEDFLSRLRGMFAFAIWDERERLLFAARDRLGIKPFHYWSDGNGTLAFASEIKALLGFVPDRNAHRELAGQFLAWNLLEHQATSTLVKGIHRLPAGESLVWRPGAGLKLRRYWTLETSDRLDTAPDERAGMVAEFRTRFDEAIALHLRSDVPVGTCLSGGLDSSAVVCAVRAELARRGAWREDWQHTFSACFEDPRLDERPYIEAVAALTGCRTHYVFPSGDRLLEDLDDWLWHQDEPVGGLGVYAQYCVARLSREHGIKVLLDGQGADEQLAGYRKFILVHLRQLMRAGRYRRAASEAVAFFTSPDILRTSRFVDGRRYLFDSVSEVSQLWPGSQVPTRPEDLGLKDSLARRMASDLLRFSLPVLLRYEDRNTMAFGIESRVPFLDHPLVEWLALLPSDMRLAGGWTKRILREGLADLLPESVRTRKTKLGFVTPESAWLEGPLAPWLAETLREPRHLGVVVDLGGVRKLWRRRLDGDRSPGLGGMLFRLAAYECWGRQFLEHRATDGIGASAKSAAS